MTAEPIIYPGSLILVTGSTGFIGAHCVKQLLQEGYKVRAALRSKSKADRLMRSVERKYQLSLSFAFISDITDLKSMQKAVVGCDGILHLASPYTYAVTNFVDELLTPAVKGTTTVMEAAINEPKVKRVVITSSFAAVYDASKGMQPGVVLTERDFSPLLWDDGANTSDVAVAYRASKIVAERAAWDFIEEKHPNFDIAVLCPPMVYGPLMNTLLLDSIASLNFSNQGIWKMCTSSSLDEVPPTKGPVWVDVRDLANAHIKALITPGASNQRFMVSAGDFCNQEIADILREKLPKKLADNIPIGEPGRRITGSHFTTDSTKAIKVLGVHFGRFEDAVLDLALQLFEYTQT
ncbi:hypothetical protein G9P44_003564 [Scheffersomyces stipitis]|nr:hypothetical protein G9P44_003564 [Scheffersomyces stipitis]